LDAVPAVNVAGLQDVPVQQGLSWSKIGPLPIHPAFATIRSLKMSPWCGKGEISMTEETEAKGNANIGWFVAGLTFGALLGVMFAPKSGKETREDIAQSTREGREYLANRGREVQEKANVLAERGKAQINEFTERGRDLVDRGRAQWDDLLSKGRDTVSETSGRVSAAVEAGKEAFRSSTENPS
jgi:gas vesicle protein